MTFSCIQSPEPLQSKMTCAQRSRLPRRSIKAAAFLRAGQLVAFPTETVYGLGANALDPKAVARIYTVKRRPPTSPLIVHVASIEMAKSLVADWPESAALLTKKFWPGPLTMVVREARAAIPPNRHCRTPDRRPAHAGSSSALALIRAAGRPARSAQRQPLHRTFSHHRRPRPPQSWRRSRLRSRRWTLPGGHRIHRPLFG